jgi:hypothetical protein
MRPHSQYCIVTCELSQKEVDQLPNLLRQVLGMPEFNTKAARMGKVIYAQRNRISYYEQFGRVKVL